MRQDLKPTLAPALRVGLDIIVTKISMNVLKMSAKMVELVPTHKETIHASVLSTIKEETVKPQLIVSRNILDNRDLCFSLFSTCSPNDYISECGGALNGETGSFQFPPNIHDRYPHNVSCAWRITTSLNKVCF